MIDRHFTFFKELHKDCHKSIEADKQTYWSNVVCEMEKAICMQ